jgi:type IV pilus assembly protein PilO
VKFKKDDAPAAEKTPKKSFSFKDISSQFQGLGGKHPGQWPSLPKISLLVGMSLALVGITYGAYSRGQVEELNNGEQLELTLKKDYQDKIKQAINLEALKKQKEQVAQYVTSLEKQLPSKSEMDALLSDINQAGVGRGLQFELFKPGNVVAREYYAELPIAVKVVGQYHDMGSFTSDIANLPRIVTLNNLQIILPDKGGPLTMDATAKTFRYLDQEEIAAARKEKEAKEKAAGGKK